MLKRCSKCPTIEFSWYEQAPDSVHRYRVQCTRCRKFLKWATESHLDEAHRDPNATIFPYKAPVTIDRFTKKK